MINYPNGKQAKISKLLDNHSRRGMSLEDDLNDTNMYYLNNDIAIVYKKPTPIKVVKVDYPERSAAKITEAYFQVPSTTDYNGIYKGRYLDFEAKQTHSTTSFALALIHDHQLKHLSAVIEHGGIAFLIIRFTTLDETYFVSAKTLLNEIHITNTHSIKHEWFEKNGSLIKYNYKIKIDYLKCIDNMEEFI